MVLKNAAGDACSDAAGVAGGAVAPPGVRVGGTRGVRAGTPAGAPQEIFFFHMGPNALKLIVLTLIIHTLLKFMWFL